jgi:hypothetical protein
MVISLHLIGKINRFFNALCFPMNTQMIILAEREVPLLMQRKPVASVSALWATPRRAAQ